MDIKFYSRYVFIPFLLVFLLGCGSGERPPGRGGEGPNGPVSFTADVQPIFDIFCVTCHRVGGIASFLPLTPESSHNNLVNQPATRSSGVLVIPGDSANSVLYLRIIGSSVGPQMPLDSSPLAVEDQDLIKDWIDSGSPSN
jgi:hypothetical protein